MEALSRLSSGLGKRIVSAVILGPLTLGVILWGGWPFIAFMAGAFLLSLKEWHGMVARASRPLLHILCGTAYIALCFMSFCALRLVFPEGAIWALGLIVAVWASDSGAYFFGKVIGGPKFAPAISPQKTWAGFSGSVLCGGAGLYLFFLLFYEGDADAAAFIPFFAAGMVLGAVGQAGDLLESFFKRRSGMKDSGNLIPGHGGMLDRIDSLLLASPAFLGMAWWWLR